MPLRVSAPARVQVNQVSGPWAYTYSSGAPALDGPNQHLVVGHPNPVHGVRAQVSPFIGTAGSRAGVLGRANRHAPSYQSAQALRRGVRP